MSEPNDFDPVDFAPIEASLRRQFAPPALDALAARVAEAAAQQDAADASLDEGPVPIKFPEPSRSPSWGLALAVVAAAAAVLLVMFGPWSGPESTPPVDPESRLAAAADPPTASEVAGRQLDGFLDRAALLPGDDGSCGQPVPPPMCDDEAAVPRLISDGTVQQLGECGGQSGLACSTFDLPADRALLVRLAPGGLNAIVCIEHPWTDPHPMLPPGSDYNIFRSQLGDYVLYEITPLEAPKATAFIRI